MTEAEWITTKLPRDMLRDYPKGMQWYPVVWDGRKVRLFWCACLRRAWNRLADEQSRNLVEEVERYPEEDMDWFVRERSIVLPAYVNWSNKTHSGICLDSWAFDALLDPPPGSLMRLVGFLSDRAAEEAPWESGFDPWAAEWSKLRVDAEETERAWQADLLREIFGNPFRPVVAEPALLTSDVLLLARGIYDDKAFDRMPILADALQDAGCDNVNVLDHCREEREHVRGCWVIDMLLGKG